jgi:hypothetical protein
MLSFVGYLAQRHAYRHLALSSVCPEQDMWHSDQTSFCVSCSREVRLTSRRAANDLRRGVSLAERRNEHVRLLGRVHLAATRDPAFCVVHTNSRW